MELGGLCFCANLFFMEGKGLKQWLSVSLREANRSFPLHRRARMAARKMLDISLNKMKWLYQLTNPHMEMMTQHYFILFMVKSFTYKSTLLDLFYMLTHPRQ